MRYRIFGERTGLKVSGIVLGTGMFGTGWGYGSDKDTAREVFDGYLTAGGNFIDTADTYQFGQSESLIGDFIGSDRDKLVIATKYTLSASATAGVGIVGNNRKTMIQSVEASLKRLKSDRIDLLWVHMPDGVTPIDEIVRGLDDLVQAGKIIYAGLSNFPAWRVAGAATLADLRGWAPIAALQTEYSLVERTSDRELLPMAKAFGLGVVAWSPLGGGFLTGKYRRGEKGRATELGRIVHVESNAQKTAILDTLLSIAAETGVPPGQIAIAWVASKGILPIIGPKNRAQLEDNLAAASLTLTADQLSRLDDVSAVPLGFPHETLAQESNRRRLAGGELDRLEQMAVPVV